jgi:hypothetical protein
MLGTVMRGVGMQVLGSDLRVITQALCSRGAGPTNVSLVAVGFFITCRQGEPIGSGPTGLDEPSFGLFAGECLEINASFSRIFKRVFVTPSCYPKGFEKGKGATQIA